MDMQEQLRQLKPEKEFFIGIDSDGCVFDTMEIKHKECFCPNFIKHFTMQKVSRYAREAWEFVNLYSRSRGVNRFPALVEVVRLLGERKEVQARNAVMPDLTALSEWIGRETKLGNPALENYARQVNDPVINLTLRWSVDVNKDIAEMVYGVPPFPFVWESLEKLSPLADTMVVSQTPLEALVREWEENRTQPQSRDARRQTLGASCATLAGAGWERRACELFRHLQGAAGGCRDHTIARLPS